MYRAAQCAHTVFTEGRGKDLCAAADWGAVPSCEWLQIFLCRCPRPRPRWHCRYIGCWCEAAAGARHICPDPDCHRHWAARRCWEVTAHWCGLASCHINLSCLTNFPYKPPPPWLHSTKMLSFCRHFTRPRKIQLILTGNVFLSLQRHFIFLVFSVCIGTNGRMSVPSNREHHYRNLRDRYTNCTFVDGNLELTWLQESVLQYL